MSIRVFTLTAMSLLLTASAVSAATVAQWRFENGTAGTDVPHTGPDGTFDGVITDVSGNGNNLSAWSQGGGTGYAYRSDVPYTLTPLNSVPNTLSVKNTGGGPGMFTNRVGAPASATNIETITPTAFTIEVSYKPENGGHRTIVGRDAQNVVTGTGALAALYLQARPDNSVGIGFADLAGNFHEAYSAPGLLQGFNFPTDNEGLTGTWYNLVGVSDGTNLKMYVDNVLVASTPIVSANPGLAIGTTNGGDWHAGGWSVGRGLFGGGHGDRAYGFIDEVRISDAALNPAQFLAPPKMTLQVNKTTGAVTLTNTAPTPTTLDFYRIGSAAGALSFANWNSLDDQNLASIGTVDGPDAGSIAGDSAGEGWDQAGGSSVNQLIEQFLAENGSTFAAGQSVTLGNAFNTSTFGAGVDGDLEFSYAVNGGAVVNGLLTYVTGSGGIPGDFDNNGKVNGNDFLVWQRGFGTIYNATHLAQWKANFGSGSAEIAAGAVPEPASMALLVVAGGVGAAIRRKR